MTKTEPKNYQRQWVIVGLSVGRTVWPVTKWLQRPKRQSAIRGGGFDQADCFGAEDAGGAEGQLEA
jgi:hypothetical protein